MNVHYINPFIKSARNVFTTMLDCPLERQGLTLKDKNFPTHEVSAVIGLSGRVCGSLVFSVSRTVAYAVVKRMLGVEVTEIDADVADAIGELTNVIAGRAKASFAEHNMSLGLPNVIVGQNHLIMFPGSIQPLCVHFRTAWGPMTLEVGLDTRLVDAEVLAQAQANS